MFFLAVLHQLLSYRVKSGAIYFFKKIDGFFRLVVNAKRIHVNNATIEIYSSGPTNLGCNCIAISIEVHYLISSAGTNIYEQNPRVTSIASYGRVAKEQELTRTRTVGTGGN